MVWWWVNFVQVQGVVLVRVNYVEGQDAILGIHLFVKVPRPGDSEVTFLVFESQSNHSKVEAIQLSALRKNTTSKLADLSSH